MSISNNARAIPALFSDAMEQLGKLVHNEVKLARAEINEKVVHAGIGVAYVAAAGVLMIPALVVLLIALAIWLSEMGMAPVGSYLTAGAVSAFISVMLGIIGLIRLKPEKLTPTVTIQQVGRDVAVAKELST
jgi:Putative Actinobacterial Holin-X, holin superfamily III